MGICKEINSIQININFHNLEYTLNSFYKLLLKENSKIGVNIILM